VLFCVQVKLLKKSEDSSRKKEESDVGDANAVVADEKRLEQELKEQREQTSILQKQLNEKLEDIDKLKVC